MVFVAGTVQFRVADPVGVAAVTVTDCAADPPVPVQVNAYFVVVVSAAVFCAPLTGSEPLQPPDAAHEVAFVEDHVKVEVPPLATVVGLAFSVTVGGAEVTLTVAVCAALPPPPVQVRV